MDRDIDELFGSLRLENQLSDDFERDDYAEDDEEDYDLDARYEKFPAKDLERVPGPVFEAEEKQSSDDDEQQRDKLLQRLEELRHSKKLLGPPGRVKKQEGSREIQKPQRPQTAKPIKAARPSSALPRAPSMILSTPTRKTSKIDRVALFQQRQKQWKRQPFLAVNTDGNRQGRKLNLAPHKHAKDFQVQKLKSVHDYIRTDFVAPHMKRRDELRLSTRAKMMQENLI